MNKGSLKVVFAFLLLAGSSGAVLAKPENSGKQQVQGKPHSTEMQRMHDRDMDRDQMSGDADEAEHKMKDKEKSLKKPDNKMDGDKPERKQLEQGPSSLEKQREKKMEQEMKESGKGSETGQTNREENRKKWWRFWD